jgi:hypothetical protein
MQVKGLECATFDTYHASFRIIDSTSFIAKDEDDTSVQKLNGNPHH